MITKTDLTIEKGYDGKLIVSCLVEGYLVVRRFMGYTRREAIKLFLTEVNK